MPQLVCRDICMNYGHNLALDRVSFSVQSGEYLCIVGENGSGKSTLLKGILGLLPLRSGSVEFAEGLGARDIGYLPQQTEVQRDFPASVYEVVLSGCAHVRGARPFYGKDAHSCARENIGLLGLSGLEKKSYRSLSGGQQQRALLARAICATGGLLFLDEPVTSLDPAVTVDFYSIVKRLNREEGLTVVMASHDIHAAVHQADRILHLNTGVLFYGSARDYVASEVSRRFLGGEHDGCVS